MVANDERMYRTCGPHVLETDWLYKKRNTFYKVPKKLIWLINLINRALCRCDHNEH